MMNERIEELARQATDFVSHIPCVIDREEAKTIYTIKLAELIVKECVAIVDGMTDPEDSDGYFWAIQNASQKIKKHFGLKQ